MYIVRGISFFFITFFFISGIARSQTVEWSQALIDNKKVPYLLILGENEDGNYFVLRSNMAFESFRGSSGFKNRTYILQNYSSDLTLLWEKELLTSYNDGHIIDVSLVNGRIIATSYIIDKKEKIWYFYVQYLDNSGKWVGNPVPVDSFSSDVADDDNKPQVIYSRDQTFISFSYRKIFKEEKTQSYQVVLMDTSLSIKYKKEISVPVPVQQFVPVDLLITNEGSFFMLGVHYATDKKVKEPNQSFFELYGYCLPLDRVVNNIISSEDKFLTDVSIAADNFNRSIVVAGFYSDKTTYSTAGVFYYSLTEDSLRETRMVRAPFSNSYLQKFMGEKQENRELVNFSIDRLLVRKDGGVAILAESKYETNRSYYDYYMQSFISHTYYHFGYVMVLLINPDGNILWNNVISKDQNSIDDGGFFSSYHYAVTGGRLVAIYNKYIDEESSVLVTTIDGTGNQKTDVLFNEISRVNIVSRSGRQIDDETILMPAYKSNKYYIIKITF